MFYYFLSIFAFAMRNPSHNLTIYMSGQLYSFSRPKVMGIINVTPDSFYSKSRVADIPSFEARLDSMLAAGADMIDLGGYSSRPGCDDISADEEFSRLAPALECIRRRDEHIIVSIDTFRADVARKCVEQFGVDIINDIAGGTLDPEMFPTVAELKVPYILMHMRGNPQNMTTLTDYSDITAEVISDLAFKLDALHQLGVCDVIIDPGFGFAKDTDGNFTLLRELPEFRELGCPILAGLSRKSMIWRALGISPEESLNGTIALNMAALTGGADILRVHDVKEAKECVTLYERLMGLPPEDDTLDN